MLFGVPRLRATLTDRVEDQSKQAGLLCPPSSPSVSQPSVGPGGPDTGERNWGLEVGHVLDAVDVPSPASTAGSGESGPSGQVMAVRGTGTAGGGELVPTWLPGLCYARVVGV